jgi:hypothetical protein
VEPFRKPDSEIEHFRIIESDGWSTPINVSVEGLPQGITAIQATAEPKNTIFKGNDGEELFVDGALAEIPLRAAASTPPGLYEVTVRGTGAFNGRSVTRSAAILNGAMRAYRSTPTLDQKLLLNILDTPPIVWNVPAEVSLSKGAPTRVKAGLVRMAGSFPITVDAKLPSGCCTAERATARPSDEEVELTITASSAPDAGRQTLVLVGAFEHNGRTERIESPPIELRIKP